MYHHFLQKGITLDYSLNVMEDERLFMQASMDLYFEEEKAKWGTT
ncbi:hypothetical protein [Viridibacillus sp. FSL H7-0596]|nr:hypothetical protein [Viridibacillus sp. FSL H7-0596]